MPPLLHRLAVSGHKLKVIAEGVVGANLAVVQAPARELWRWLDGLSPAGGDEGSGPTHYGGPQLQLAGVGGHGIDLENAEVDAGDDRWGEWGEAIMLAVPKSKVTRSVKRMRMSGKWPKKITNFTMCKKCGQPKLAHKLCSDIELCASRDDDEAQPTEEAQSR